MTVIAIPIRRKSYVTDTVEVDFPVYSKCDVSDENSVWVRFMRWDADGTMLSVVQVVDRRGKEQFTLDKDHVSWPRDEDRDYVLGEGEYACTQKEFDDVFALASMAILGVVV